MVAVSVSRGVLLAQVSTTVNVRDQIRSFIADRYPHPHAVHVVVPDPKLDRTPWVEVRWADSEKFGIDALWSLQDQIESAWPNIEFEFLNTDAEDL